MWVFACTGVCMCGGVGRCACEEMAYLMSLTFKHLLASATQL